MRTIGPLVCVFLLVSFIVSGQNDDTHEQKKASHGYDISDPEAIKTNILRYASDSLLTIRQNLQVKFKKKPKVASRNRVIFLGDADIVVLDFVNGYYKLAANDLVFYMDPGNLTQANFDFSDKRDYVLELKNKKESMEREAAEKEYLEEQLKQKEHYVSKWGQSVYDRVQMGQYWLGMTEEMAKVGGLYPGERKVNTLVTVFGRKEQWNCKNGVLLVFEGGILRAIEDGAIPRNLIDWSQQ